MASGRVASERRRLALDEEVFDDSAPNRTAVGSSNAWNEGEEGFVDLRPVGLLGKEKVGQPFEERHK